MVAHRRYVVNESAPAFSRYREAREGVAAVLGWESLVAVVSVSSVDGQPRAVPWQTRRVEWRGSQAGRTSGQGLAHGPPKHTRQINTHVPKLCPSRKIRMIYATLRIHVLAWPDHHSLGRGHVCQRGLLWVRIRHPYRHRKAVCRSSE